MGRVFTPKTSVQNVLRSTFESMSDITLRLFQSATLVSKETVLGDFTEADYDGYAAAAVSNPSVALGDGAFGNWADKATADTLIGVFPASIGAPQTVYGMYATATTGEGTVLLAAANSFDSDPESALDGYEVAGDLVQLTLTAYLWDYEATTSPWADQPPFVVTGNPSFENTGNGAFHVRKLDRLGNFDATYAGTIDGSSETAGFVFNGGLSQAIVAGEADFTVACSTTGLVRVIMTLDGAPEVRAQLWLWVTPGA